MYRDTTYVCCSRVLSTGIKYYYYTNNKFRRNRVRRVAGKTSDRRGGTRGGVSTRGATLSLRPFRNIHQPCMTGWFGRRVWRWIDSLRFSAPTRTVKTAAAAAAASESRLPPTMCSTTTLRITAAATEQLISRKTRDQTGGVCSRTPPV
ncbi:unnamed protein product [Aphis gossypii]|uniref:Uncharacterized protein n=1 Tax=Aphis gossypii TaxID=80765 RepID=A0A9P0NCD3_APHGO|nr:unnamed protein product [Aphis gossypii]